MLDCVVQKPAFSSRTSAATIVALGLTFWLPYLTSATGSSLVNPLWAVVFGVLPSLLAPMKSLPLTFFAVFAAPVLVMLGVGAIVVSATPKISRAVHIVLWISLASIVPMNFAMQSETFRSVSVYRFMSM